MTDNIEFVKHLEIAQYAFLYTIIGFPLAYLSNIMFPPLDKKKHLWRIVAEVIAQIIIMAVFFYYMRKIVMSIPFWFGSLSKNYVPYRTGEYLGQAVGAYIVFFYLQTRLATKLTYLSEVIYQQKYKTLNII